MASLFKRPNSTVWWCQFYVKDASTGKLKKVRKSTGHTSKKAALPAALEMERTAQGVIEAGSDKSRRAKAIMAEAVEGIERETFNMTTARKLLAEMLKVATGEDFPAFTIDSWLDEWLRRKERESSPATMKRYQKSLDTFRGWLGDERRKKPLESVTIADIRRWRESLQDTGIVGKTVQKYMKDLGGAFRAAIREGLTSSNPCGGLEAVSTDDSMSRRPFALEEVGALLAAAPSDEWRGLILIAAFTGLRMSDAAKLMRTAVNLESRQISMMPAKTARKKRTVTIPIQPDLFAFLEARLRSLDETEIHVLPAMARAKPNGRTGLSETFVKLMASAGVDRGKTSRDRDSEKTAGRVTYERGFHSFRHTFTTWLRSAGVSEEDRMALTGHATRDSHAIYSHAEEEKLREAISRLPLLGS